MVLWLSLGAMEGLAHRLSNVGAAWQIMFLGLIINTLADFVSLYETRLLLELLKRNRAVAVQVVVLLFDFVLTAIIILFALWIVQASGLTARVLGEERAHFAEIIGLFSPLAIFFYSTFVTSIWTWVFILSTWLMRLLAGIRWLHSVYDEHPGKALTAAIGGAALLIGFTVSAALAALTSKDNANLSLFDRLLCSFAKGEVCLHVRSLTEDDAARLALTLDACRGGLILECLSEDFNVWERESSIASRYLSAACETGDGKSCANLGYLNEKGLGMAMDPGEAKELYEIGCESSYPRGCTNLGVLYHRGLGVEEESVAVAADYFRLGCESGDARGCTNLGVIFEKGQGGFERSTSEAARLYQLSCDGGHSGGCTSLGFLHHQGTGMETNPWEAARLYQLGCDGGEARGCFNLGELAEFGYTAEARQKIARLVEQSCEPGADCGPAVQQNLQELVRAPDYGAAQELYQTACSLKFALGCISFAELAELNLGSDTGSRAAQAAYRKAGGLGFKDACGRLTPAGD